MAEIDICSSKHRKWSSDEFRMGTASPTSEINAKDKIVNCDGCEKVSLKVRSICKHDVSLQEVVFEARCETLCEGLHVHELQKSRIYPHKVCFVQCSAKFSLPFPIPRTSVARPYSRPCYFWQTMERETRNKSEIATLHCMPFPIWRQRSLGRFAILTLKYFAISNLGPNEQVVLRLEQWDIQ